MSLDERQLRRNMGTLLLPLDPAPGALDRVHAAVRRRRRRTRGASVAGAVVAVAGTVLVITTLGDVGPAADTAPVGPPTSRASAPPPQQEKVSPATDPYVYYDTGVLKLYYVDPRSGDSRPLAATEHDEYASDLSPDGTEVAFVRNVDGSDSEIYVVNVDGSRERRLTDGPFTAGAPRWSPGGERIAYWRQTAEGKIVVWILDLSTGQERPVTPNDEVSANPWWSSDGQSIFFGGDGLEELDLDSGESRTVARLDSTSPGATSPDESLIVVAGDRMTAAGFAPGPLIVLDRQTGRTVWRSDAEFIEVQDLTWTGDEIVVVHDLPQARATIVHLPALD